MRAKCLFTSAFFCIVLAARGLAQDVSVADPVWLGQDPPPDVMPQTRHRLRPDFPREMRKTDEIGYVIVIRTIDADGKELGERAMGSEVAFERSVQDEFEDWTVKPGLRAGKAIKSDFWVAAIFNPASAKKDGPTASPRLLEVTPVWVGNKLSNELGDRPTVRTRLQVDANGKVTGVAVENMNVAVDFESAIRQSVAHWRFAPARVNGQPAAAQVSLPVLIENQGFLSLTGGKSSPARPIKQESPNYPLAMEWSRLVGQVLVEFKVDVKGDVQNATIKTSNNPGFDDEALATVRKWKFQPAVKDGEPVNSTMQVPIVFQIPGAEGRDAYSFQGGSQSKLPPEFQYDSPPRIRGTIVPIYPYNLLRDAISGRAKVMVLVNAQGRVARTKVLEATRPEFGLALVAALETFEFDPATKKWQADPGSWIAQEQEFSWNMMGSNSATSSVGWDMDLARSIEKHPEKIVSAGKLDQRLHPVSRRPPIFPAEIRSKTDHGAATVEIVIDEDGRARIPRVVSASEPAFGYAAVQAIAFWRFDPPLSGGKKVKTKVQVPFDFVTPKS